MIVSKNDIHHNIMKTGLRKYSLILKELKVTFPKLTEYEMLTLAVQIERNEILENGLAVSRDDHTSSGIEAIVNAVKDLENRT